MSKIDNSEWEVENEKVKIGSEWKTKKQLQRSFLMETILFIAFSGLCIWAFTEHIVFGLVALIIVLYLLVLAIGSYTALKALGTKIFEFSMPKKKKDAPKKILAKSDKENFDIEHAFNATLVKTMDDERQEIIKSLQVDGLLEVNENYEVSTQKGKMVGELSKVNIEKLSAFPNKGIKCKVLEIGENRTGKKTVKVEMLIIK